MTQEEKAKAYDKAIRKLRGMMPNWERLSYNGKTFLQDLIYIFPELKKSENEEIKEYLISFIKMESGVNLSPDDAGKILAWLEKQGQKPYGQRKECLDCQFNYAGECKGSCAMKRSERKPTEWSIEDTFKVQRICKYLDEAKKYYADITEVEDCIDWLKFLKDRAQSKSEWSEEDEQIILSIEQVMACASLLNIVPEKIDKIRTWLKSIKQRIGG